MVVEKPIGVLNDYLDPNCRGAEEYRGDDLELEVFTAVDAAGVSFQFRRCESCPDARRGYVFRPGSFSFSYCPVLPEFVLIDVFTKQSLRQPPKPRSGF